MIAALVAAVVLLPGLGTHGFWSDAELPALDRVLAALGAGMSDLVRSPWLPDLLRERSYAVLGGEVGLRLPHALAAIALVAMTTGVARSRGASPWVSLLAGGFALAFPVVAVAGRTALGNPVAEALGVAAVLMGLLALRSPSLVRASLAGIVAAGLLALSVASAGLAIGGALPLGALAVAASVERPGAPDGERACIHPRIAVFLWLGFVVTLGIAVMLSLRQGNGYIPLLGAAKDLVLIDKPENRRFAAGLEDLGYGLFPWAPLCVAGALLGRRDRLPALWLGLGVTIASGWSLVYGPVPLPIIVPAALGAAAAVEWMQDPRTDRTGRRLALTVVVLGMLVVGKDASRTPGRVTVPLFAFEGEHSFPGQQLQAPERLGRIGSAALWALLLAGLLAPAGGRGHRVDRLLDRMDPARRAAAPLMLLGAATLVGAWGYAQRLVPETCDLLSPRRVLEHHRALVEAGVLSPQLGNHRVRDEGLSLHGPGDVLTLASRRELATYLGADEPRAALIRERDLPALHQDHRQNGWPLFVLDDHHAHLRLVANLLPSGEEDRNPIPGVLFDEPQPLRHPTMLRFENYIEIIGWEVTEPVVRGRKATLQLSIRVLRPLPGGSQIYARLLKDRTSRINGEPHDLTGGIYPPNLWREGDYILHRFEFEAPALEIQPGPHELIVGLRRNERQNFDISVPQGDRGEHGVVIKGKKRNFAALGEVEVW
ncbi:UbiA prenyltransferase family protein [Paraliomyxa miuraensis]|uniref:hypothetical protein n=1 Tax=Paraliomyxa miuraensis TaxID=376150 RepID=UPI002259D191|nr:hypothetical protein [Paraliomyxa miuraensis]MCX4242266.1 hypothetical protein [Paraliomyxa miuraensis]